jgi:hypothetical protein
VLLARREAIHQPVNRPQLIPLRLVARHQLKVHVRIICEGEEETKIWVGFRAMPVQNVGLQADAHLCKQPDKGVGFCRLAGGPIRAIETVPGKCWPAGGRKSGKCRVIARPKV